VPRVQRYRRNPQTAGRVIDGQAFVVTPDDNRLHTLNAAATRLWSLAQQPISVDEAARALTEVYDIDEPTALRDATACLDDMVARAILLAES